MPGQPDLSLADARKLYREFRDRTDDDAIRAMARIAIAMQRQQVEGGRMRLLSLRQLGRILIERGRRPGRPLKTSDDDVLVKLADLGIEKRRYLAADARAVARMSQADFDAYLAQETEPTLAGLLRFGDHTRSGRPYPVPSINTRSVPLAMQRGRLARASLLGNNEQSTTEWYTPPELFEAMEVEFDLDVCSPGRKIVPWIPARRHLTRRENGLVVPWHGFVFMNPPYGLRNGVAEWVDKFVQHDNGVAIAPDFTSTEWWHNLTMHADMIMFARPKVLFLPKREDARTNSLGSTLVAMGAQGVRALRNAERNDRGLCFRRDKHGKARLQLVAS